MKIVSIGALALAISVALCGSALAGDGKITLRNQSLTSKSDLRIMTGGIGVIDVDTNSAYTDMKAIIAAPGGAYLNAGMRGGGKYGYESLTTYLISNNKAIADIDISNTKNSDVTAYLQARDLTKINLDIWASNGLSKSVVSLLSPANYADLNTNNSSTDNTVILTDSTWAAQ